MGDPQEIFNILIEQELNKNNIELNNSNYQKPSADSKIIKCYQRGLDLTNQSKTNESLTMKVNELTAFDKVKDVVKDMGLAYNNDNIVVIDE